MSTQKPGILEIIRAPFLSSILSPLFVGTLLAVSISNDFNIMGFILVLIVGISLHAATNVYNDIYDTLQGTDRINIHRNEFSGGSGLLVENPELLERMFWIARKSMIISFLGTIGLCFVVSKNYWPHLFALLVLSAVFSKYYTAAPIKLSHRGVGELAVWFAFGPMAILIAAVGQNVGFHPIILLAMPITGLSTASILFMGEMIDLQADRESGKWGVVVRIGSSRGRYVYLIVQLLLIVNIIILAAVLENGLYILISIIPYLILFPRIWKIVFKNHDNPKLLYNAAKLNVALHLLFSLLFIIGVGLRLVFF